MGRIIEAKAVISGEDRTGAMFDSIARKMKAVGKGAKASVEVERLNKALQTHERGLRAIERVNSAQKSFSESRAAFQVAQNHADRIGAKLDAARKAAAAFDGVKAFSKTSGIGKEIAAARAEVVALEKAFTTAQRSVRTVSGAYQSQSSALMAARHAAERSGVSVGKLTAEQNRLKAAVEGANAALQRQAARQERREARKGAAGTIAAGAGVIAAHKGKTIGLDAVQSAADFDLAVRKQKVFTDISSDDQANLLTQAKRIGQETQFSNIDVVKAQTAAMQGLPAGFAPKLKAEVAEGIVGNVRNFATLMETDLKDGTEIIRGYLQQSGKDISTKEKALAEANKATNQLVKMAKLGGMDGEDVKNFANYAIAPGTAAGLSPESLMSLGALARRGGLRGDVAGVAVRSMASKIVAPTSKGLAALNAAGVNHSDFVKMPDSVSTSALEGQFRMKLGKGFTPKIRKDLDRINSNKELLGDSGKYTEAVTKAVGDILGKTKKGQVRASDSQKAAKAAFEFHKVSAKSVDAEGLLDAAFKAKMTLPQLNAWLTDKHGGKGAITQRQWDEYHAARGQISKAAEDPDWAKKKADEVFAGLGGAVENLKGSWENLILSIGNANEGLIRFTADGLGKGIDAFSNLDKTSQQALSILGFGAAGAGGVMGAMKLAGALFGPGGGAVALTGSATALTGSAAALDAAAIKLAGGSAVGNAVDKGGKAAGAAGLAGLFGAVALPLIGAGAATAAVYYGSDETRGIVHGGRPDASSAQNPSDVLPGVKADASTSNADTKPEALGKSKTIETWKAYAPTWLGGAPNANPPPAPGGQAGGKVPERSALPDWWQSRAPTWLGGTPNGGTVPVDVKALPSGSDASGQVAALGNTLSKASDASATAANGGKPVEATVKPDQIVAKVENLPPVTGEATVTLQPQRIVVELNTDMLNARIDSRVSSQVAKIPLAASGGRPGATSMPGAATTPGAAK